MNGLGVSGPGVKISSACDCVIYTFVWGLAILCKGCEWLSLWQNQFPETQLSWSSPFFTMKPESLDPGIPRIYCTALQTNGCWYTPLPPPPPTTCLHPWTLLSLADPISIPMEINPHNFFVNRYIFVGFTTFYLGRNSEMTIQGNLDSYQ